MRRTKIKHGIIFFAVILLIVCAGIAISALNKTENNFLKNLSETTSPIEGSSAVDTVQELHGTVKDATMNTLTVLGADNCEYCFGTDGIEISSGKTGIVIGNPVTVLYCGTLDPTSSVQDVELRSVTVEDADLTGNNSETADEPSESSESGNSPVTAEQRAQEILN